MNLKVIHYIKHNISVHCYALLSIYRVAFRYDSNYNSKQDDIIGINVCLVHNLPNTAVHQLAKLNIGHLANRCRTAVPSSFIECEYHNVLQTFLLLSALINLLELGINQIISGCMAQQADFSLCMRGKRRQFGAAWKAALLPTPLPVHVPRLYLSRLGWVKGGEDLLQKEGSYVISFNTLKLKSRMPFSQFLSQEHSGRFGCRDLTWFRTVVPLPPPKKKHLGGQHWKMCIWGTTWFHSPGKSAWESHSKTVQDHSNQMTTILSFSNACHFCMCSFVSPYLLASTLICVCLDFF